MVVYVNYTWKRKSWIERTRSGNYDWCSSWQREKALETLSKKSQEEIDHIVHQMSLAAVDQHMVLAKLAHEETGRGIYEDKAIKNLYASEYIWNSIKDNKTVGIIGEDKEKD